MCSEVELIFCSTKRYHDHYSAFGVKLGSKATPAIQLLLVRPRALRKSHRRAEKAREAQIESEDEALLRRLLAQQQRRFDHVQYLASFGFGARLAQ